MSGAFQVPGSIPFVPGQYDYRPGDRISDLIMRSGEIQAQNAQRQGDIWGNAIAGAGQAIGGALQQRQQQKEQRTVGTAVSSALTQAKASPDTFDLGTVLKSVDPRFHAQVTKAFNDANAAASVMEERQARTAQIKLEAQRLEESSKQAAIDYAGTLAGHAKPFLAGEDGGFGAVKMAVAHAKSKKVPGAEQFDGPLQQAGDAFAKAQATGDPGAVAAVADQFRKMFGPILEQMQVGMSPAARKALMEEGGEGVVVPEGGTLVNKRTGEPMATGGTKVPKVGTFEDYVVRKFGPQPSPDQIEGARKKWAEEGHISVNVNGPGGTGALTPDAVEFAGTQFRVTGKMPAMGMGNGPARAAIMNEAAKQAKALGQSPVVAIQRQAAYAGDSKALAKMQSMSAAASSFEQKAIAQADIVSSLSDKVSRTQFPLINQAILSGKAAFGDTDTQLLYNAITTFTSEYAKIMEGSTGSAAGSSDAARTAANRLISAKLKNGTLQATLDLMRREMALTIGGYDATIGHITERMGGTVPTQAGPPANTATKDPLSIR